MVKSSSIRNVSSSSTRPGRPPTWRAYMAGRPRANGCAPASRKGIGKLRPSLPAFASPASPHRCCSTVRSTAMPSRPMSSRCWCPNSVPATSWLWIICRAIRGWLSDTPLRRPAQACSSCRPTAQTSTHRERLRQAEGAAQSSGRANRRRTVGQDRHSPRLLHPTRMRQLLRRCWIRCNLISNGSSPSAWRPRWWYLASPR